MYVCMYVCKLSVLSTVLQMLNQTLSCDRFTSVVHKISTTEKKDVIQSEQKVSVHLMITVQTHAKIF
jgi:hypothetical protein